MSRINWRETLGWNEDHLEDLRTAGYAYIRQGKYEIALPIFEALTVLDPESAYDFQTFGGLLIETGKPEKAIAVLNKALKLEADHGPTLLNLTKALFMLDRKDEALKLAEILQNEKDLRIANAAKAMLLAFQ